MNPADYLVGRPVYRAASNAPTRGTVDPMGYIDRQLNSRSFASPVGGDGFSDKRSGLAQAALQRLQQGQGSPQSQPQGMPQGSIPGGPIGYIVSPTGRLIPTHDQPYQ